MNMIKPIGNLVKALASTHMQGGNRSNGMVGSSLSQRKVKLMSQPRNKMPLKKPLRSHACRDNFKVLTAR